METTPSLTTDVNTYSVTLMPGHDELTPLELGNRPQSSFRIISSAVGQLVQLFRDKAMAQRQT